MKKSASAAPAAAAPRQHHERAERLAHCVTVPPWVASADPKAAAGRRQDRWPSDRGHSSGSPQCPAPTASEEGAPPCWSRSSPAATLPCSRSGIGAAKHAPQVFSIREEQERAGLGPFPPKTRDCAHRGSRCCPASPNRGQSVNARLGRSPPVALSRTRRRRRADLAEQLDHRPHRRRQFIPAAKPNVGVDQVVHVVY